MLKYSLFLYRLYEWFTLLRRHSLCFLCSWILGTFLTSSGLSVEVDAFYVCWKTSIRPSLWRKHCECVLMLFCFFNCVCSRVVLCRIRRIFRSAYFTRKLQLPSQDTFQHIFRNVCRAIAILLWFAKTADQMHCLGWHRVTGASRKPPDRIFWDTWRSPSGLFPQWRFRILNSQFWLLFFPKQTTYETNIDLSFPESALWE